jgi:hypothetical protein
MHYVVYALAIVGVVSVVWSLAGAVRSSSDRWEVTIENTTRYGKEGRVTVALRRGRERMAMDSINVSADNFDSALDTARLRAEDRAAQLNAARVAK